MAKSAPHNVARQTGSITPAMAAARKAARLAAEAKHAVDVESLKEEINSNHAENDPFYKSALVSILKTVSKNHANGKSREIQAIEAGYVYHSTHSIMWKLEHEVTKIRDKIAGFGVVKNVNGIHLYVKPLKGN